MKIVEADTNVTIPYDQGVRPYHTVLAQLIKRYATGDHRTLFDFGCGVGNTLVEISKWNPGLRYVVADLDARCLSITSTKVPVEKAVLLDTPDALYDLADTFDLILLSHTLQYDPEPHRTMRKLLDMLRPGGYLLLASPNPSTPTKILHNVVRRYYSEGIFTWDRSVLRNFVRSFEDAHIEEITHDYLPLPFLNKYQAMKPVLVTLGNVLPWLSFSIIVVVRKGARQ